MNLHPIARRLAELLHAEGADDLIAGSEDTKAAATRLYFEALPTRQRGDELVEAIAERLDAGQCLAVMDDTAALGALIAGDLYLHAESQLREPVADALVTLERDLNISAAVDAAIDRIRDGGARRESDATR